MGGSGAPFGEPWGALGRPWGDPGAPSEPILGKQASLQNHWFYFIKWYILPPRGGLGGPWGRPVDRQDGQRQGEWSPRSRRQARNKASRSRWKKGRGKKYGDHRPEPSREGPLSKMALPPTRGWYFCKIDERKKRPQNSIYSRNGAAKGAPGASLGGPWVPLAGPVGDLWGSLKRLLGAQGDPWTPISADRRPSKIIGFII